MKNLKHILLFLPLLLMFSACEKEKLEDSEKGKQLLGKWKYQYGGYHTSSLNFVTSVNPIVKYEIEFLEDAKYIVRNGGGEEEFKIKYFGESQYFTYAEWYGRIRFGEVNNGESFEVHYYSEDSIAIDILPHTPFTPSLTDLGLNVFYRVE